MQSGSYSLSAKTVLFLQTKSLTLFGLGFQCRFCCCLGCFVLCCWFFFFNLSLYLFAFFCNPFVFFPSSSILLSSYSIVRLGSRKGVCGTWAVSSYCVGNKYYFHWDWEGD